MTGVAFLFSFKILLQREGVRVSTHTRMSRDGAGGGGEGEGDAHAPLSREPEAWIHPRTPGS